MAFHIILGGPNRKETTELVYAGPSGGASREAMEASSHAVHCILDNPLARYKNNPKVAKAKPASAEEEEEAAEPESHGGKGKKK